MNMNYNNMFGGAAAQYANQKMRMPTRWTNPLTEKEEAMLKSKTESFSLAATKEEMARATCTHRDPKRNIITLIANNDNTVTCTKCGARFHLVTDKPKEEIEKILNAAVDIFESTKVMSLDAPDSFIKSVYPIIPITAKFSDLYETVSMQWSKYGVQDAIEPATAYGDPFNLLASAVGGTMPMGMGVQQPVGMGMPPMGNGMAQPQFMNAPGAGWGQGMDAQNFNPWQTGGGVAYSMPMMDNSAQVPSMQDTTQPMMGQQPSVADTNGNVSVTKKFDI